MNDRSGRNHGKSQKEPNRNQKEEEEAQQGLSCGEEHSQRHAEAEDQPKFSVHTLHFRSSYAD